MKNITNFSQYIEQRFWPKIKKGDVNECWEWLASTSDKGYGQVVWKGKHFLAHRISWELKNGSIPRDKVIMHRCDNPGCNNPAHLLLGTQADNLKDMRLKGREAKGEKHGRRKLTEQQAKEILASDVSQTALGKKYNVSRRTVNFIKNGINWKHLSGENNAIYI